jgi:hypothetical protein
VELFLLCALSSVVVGWIGRDRKFGFWGYFFCSLALTPIVGLVIVLASDRRKKVEGDNATAASSSAS